MANYQLVATSAMGLESIVAQEVKALGYETTVENGKVYFEGDETAIARTNLWLRVADRVKIVVGQFPAKSFEQLFESVKALPWEKYLPVDAAFPVSGKSVKSKLFSVPDCQAITKKAIVERMKQHYKRLGFLDESGATYKIEVSILKDVATLTIDTSGAGLHKRGYRQAQGEAPLKETLAAALVQISKWNPNRPFVDPFCGSGTITLEAAMFGQNIAPGYNREFISEDWPWMKAAIWDQVRDEAESLANYDQPLEIIGSDIDHRMVSIAQENAIEAGFGELITFKQMQARDFTTQLTDGVMIGNPPYGERIGDVEVVEQVIRDVGKVMKNYPSWSVYMLSSMKNFEELYGRQATKKRKLFNGFIETNYYQFWGQKSKRD
ncbi:MAG TPA: class I SAM-dependent RNA methyltransferase [Lysinibacillus sp.]|jgi:putative N6-adenine-specific DNA methylase|uniref:Class I SAM-dependent RNA methyltransferase n=1 Tax=Lysinibacillus fusiformis TaxID=28031 RepID=A0A2I0V3A1_9BACI|nr:MULTISPECIES: class I SAM-dependent RNA methyltransferase [Lysinibacillus]HBT72441.1 class I SAM-dependent RNA methyltransferase [Lysinibacillus sp.]MEE3808789.1 class I SAM-dependent RNA methyltransferase [Lysinibacillus fusiformis]PKU52787.1 class I SAM-dependent RNA methyltransferase [Lysinibacillus fusiformis]WCH49256.1 class I SAM-dependent RNA methyltransferase [Lysinibacillus sp. OF-1]SCY60011.1 putative N6-adenine-specific DNA methylase [Lysinibacillus sp. SG9]